MNIVIETHQIFKENTSKDSKWIKSSIYDTINFKNFIGALKTEKIRILHPCFEMSFLILINAVFAIQWIPRMTVRVNYGEPSFFL